MVAAQQEGVEVVKVAEAPADAPLCGLLWPCVAVAAAGVA